jgi:type I restriction enzyme S subunit
VSTLGEVLEFAGKPERITQTNRERFVTLKVRGGGAVRRVIKDGKAPAAFTGYRVAAGQFIYSRIDARNGAFAIVPPGLDGAVVSKDFPIFRIREERVEPGYLLHYMRAGQLEAQIRRSSFGATNRQRIAEEVLLGFQIPLPPLPEQLRITEVLDRAETLANRRRSGRGHLLELIESQYERHTLGASEVTIAQLLREGVLAVHKDGNHGSLYPRSEEFAPSGVPFLTARTIREDGTILAEAVDHLNEEKANQLRIGWIRGGDVLLSHNASVGKVAVYEGQFGDALIGTSLTSFRADPDRLDPRFLAASLRSSFFQRQLTHNMAQTTRNQVPITAQRELQLRLLDLEQQRAFVAIAEKINTLLHLTRRAVGAQNELVAALRSRAFRGEL